MREDTRAATANLDQVVADLEDAVDRIGVLERRVIRLTVATDLLTDRMNDVETAILEPVQAVPPVQAVDVDDVGYVMSNGPWGANLGAIKEIPARRQRQVLLLPEIWDAQGMTARQIVDSLSERYPAQPMNAPNVYPLLKKMIALGLVEELDRPDEADGSAPARFVVSRKTFPG